MCKLKTYFVSFPFRSHTVELSMRTFLNSACVTRKCVQKQHLSVSWTERLLLKIKLKQNKTKQKTLLHIFICKLSVHTFWN